MALKRKIVDLEASANKLSVAVKKSQFRRINNIKILVSNKVDEIVGLMSSAPASLALSMKRAELTNLITTLFSELTVQQQEEVTKMLTSVYNNTRVNVSAELGQMFDVTNDFQVKRLLERQTQNLTLSQRIHFNNKLISERVNNDIGRMLFQNASPNDIKRQIAADFKISYNAADRLIRTETATFYSQACHDSYKAAGLEEVEFLAEATACDECQSKDGKLYSIDSPTPVPVHPNCRCVILPVIKD